MKRIFRITNIAILTALCLNVVSCVSVQRNMMSRREMSELQVLGPVEVQYRSWQPLHIPIGGFPTGGQKAYNRLLEVAREKYDSEEIYIDNIDVVNVTAEGSWSWVQAPLFLPFVIMSPAVIVNVQNITATGTAILRNQTVSRPVIVESESQPDAAASGAELPRIAFYFYGEEPRTGVFRPLGGEITKAIVRSGNYIAIDRTDAVRELIVGEQLYQRSGAVDENQVSAFGKQWGVRYVISLEISPALDGNFFIEAKMVDVEGAFIARMGTVTTRLDRQRDLDRAATRIIRDLLSDL